MASGDQPMHGCWNGMGRCNCGNTCALCSQGWPWSNGKADWTYWPYGQPVTPYPYGPYQPGTSSGTVTIRTVVEPEPKPPSYVLHVQYKSGEYVRHEITKVMLEQLMEQVKPKYDISYQLISSSVYALADGDDILIIPAENVVYIQTAVDEEVE